MSFSPRSSRFARRLVIAASVAMVAVVAPLPVVDFVDVASAQEVGPPDLAPMSTGQIDELQERSDEPIGEDRLVGGSELDESFSAIGVSLTASPAEPILMRVKESAGWSEWVEIEVLSDEDTGPDPGTAEAQAGTVPTEPIWVGDSNEFEVAVAEADADLFDVAVVRETTRRVIGVDTDKAGASPTIPINGRSSWNARTPSSSISVASRLNLGVVHHTAGNSVHTAEQVPSILRTVQAWHMDNNGWSDIGYNFLVDRFGRVWEGRDGSIDGPAIGAHAAGFNTGSVGVSIIGNYVSTNASAAALEATARVLGWRLGTAGVNPTSRVNVVSGGSNTIPAGRTVNLPRIIGHRDVGATTCPGAVYGSMAAIRNRAGQWYMSLPSVGKPAGALDAVSVDGRTVSVRGWASDPTSASPMTVHVYVGGRPLVLSADRKRPDVAQLRPEHGADVGFEGALSNLPAGEYRVCAYGISPGGGSFNLDLGCRTVVVK